MPLDRTAIEKALDTALKRGAADAEIVVTRDTGLQISVAKSKVETLALSESIGAGVRVFTHDRRMGFAYTTSEESIERTAEVACENALLTEPDEHNVLPEEAATSKDDWSEEDFAMIPVAEKVEFCRRLEQETLAADSRMTHVQDASYSDARGEFAIANSRGLFREFQNTQCSCWVLAAAAQPGVDPEMGWEFDATRTFAGLRREWAAGRCAESASRALGGTPCPTGGVPIVLDNYVATALLSVLAPALMAHNVLKGKSLFAASLDEAIASEHVTIIDQNDLDIGLNRSPFDAEGASAQSTVILDQGVLRGFLQNSYTAHKMGRTTTANAGRGGGFRGAPEVSASNCFIKAGPHSPEDLYAAAGAGLFVTDAMGMHTANPISGDFSFGVSGLTIEQGRLGRPVRGVTVAGNLKDLLRRISAVGNDLRFFGAYGAPSVLVSQLMVSGIS